MSETIVKIKWRSTTLPLTDADNVSNPVLCITDKGAKILSYDFIVKCWFYNDNPKQSFKGEVIKWCNVPE